MTSRRGAVLGREDGGGRPWGEPPLLGPINAHCRRHICGFHDFVAISAIGEGYSNPTYRVETAVGEFQILRAMPSRRSAKSAHRIDREYQVLTALQDSPVPVPRPIYYCPDAEPAGTPFYLMGFVEGPVFSGNRLPSDLAARRRVFLVLAECLGRLHTVDYRAHGLEKFGSRSGVSYVERQVATMTKLYRDTEMNRIPEMDELIALLQGFAPEADEPCLIHGDYRLGNVVIDPNLQKVAAVLDWELSTIGDPFTDVAYCLLMYHWDSQVFGTVTPGTPGVPGEAEFLERYCQVARRETLPDLTLYGAFSMFRLACITQAAIHREASGQPLARALPPEQYPAAIARAALKFAERRAPTEGR